MNRPSVILFFLTTLSLYYEPQLQADDEARRPNFIVFLVDDLGWRDLGCFGSDFYETPNLDRFAAGAMKFTDAYAACTVCSPTRAAMMTGMYPARTRVTDYITGGQPAKSKLLRPDWNQRLNLEYTTIAEALKAAGYRTAHVGKWHLMPRGKPEMNDYLPQFHGFDINIGGNEWGAPGSYFYPYESSRRNVGKLPPGGKEGDYLTDQLTREAVKILEAYAGEPFFMYFAYYNVHTPLEGKPDVIEKFKDKLRPGQQHTNPTYAAMLASVDDSVGRILATLEELGLADDTVIIFTGDNGGLDRRGNPTDNAPLREGKGHVYEGGVREPTIVRWPGVTKSGTVCDEPIITCDYYPTILEIAGVAGDKNHNRQVDGLSIVPLLRDETTQLNRDALYWHYPHYHSGGATPYGSIRARDWKLIEFYEDMRVELYHLKDDISESRNIAALYPRKAAELTERLHGWRKKLDAQMPIPNPAYEP